MHKYFVWITGSKGPEAQLWAEKQVDGGGKAKDTLFTRTLSPYEQHKSLDFLAAAYPLEVVSEPS